MPVLKTQTLMRFNQHIRKACTNSLVSFHHGKGSEMPKVNPDKITLINMRFCPYAQRTVLCLNAKEIDYEVINVALFNKPEWLWEMNPLGKVPVLIHEGHAISESLITCDYIDEVFPGRKLHSSDAAVKARDKMFVEMFNKVLMPHLKIIYGWRKGLGPEERAKLWTDSMINLDVFEKELMERKTTYFGGELSPGYLDYMVWPWMERIETYEKVFEGESSLAFEQQRYPSITAWMENMKDDPAVKEYMLTDEVHVAFVRSMATGSPNYNMLIN